MTTPLTREQVETCLKGLCNEIADGMWPVEADLVRCTDAALRAQLAGVEKVRDEYFEQWHEAVESEDRLRGERDQLRVDLDIAIADKHLVMRDNDELCAENEGLKQDKILAEHTLMDAFAKAVRPAVAEIDNLKQQLAAMERERDSSLAHSLNMGQRALELDQQLTASHARVKELEEMLKQLIVRNEDTFSGAPAFDISWDKAKQVLAGAKQVEK